MRRAHFSKLGELAAWQGLVRYNDDDLTMLMVPQETASRRKLTT